MGKNSAAKKGKQREPTPVVSTSAPPPPSLPPPAVSSPPSAHHIQHTPGTIDIIEEREVERLSGVPEEGAEEESWQSVSRSANGWMADAPGNGNADLDAGGWESRVVQAPIPPLPPHLPQNKVGGGDRTTRGAYYPQQQLRSPPMDHQDSGFVGTHKSSAPSTWNFPKNQPDAWTPEDNEWEEEGGGEEGEEEEEEWGDRENGDDWGGNNSWNGDNGGWDQQPHSAAWIHAISAPSVHSQTTSQAPTSGWRSWGEEARRLPKVTFDPAIPPSPSSTGSKPVLSQLQRSQILNELLSNPQQTQQPYPMRASVVPAIANTWQPHQSSRGNRHQQQHHEPRHGLNDMSGSRGISKWTPPQQQRKRGKQRQEEHDVWGLGDGWSDSHEEEQQDMSQDAWGRRVHFSPGALRASMLPSSAPSVVPSTVVENFTVNALPQNKLGLSTIPMSKTLSYAYSGTTPSTESEPGRAAMQRITDFQFIESRGEALKSVQHAFYGKQRKAVDRFHWLFSPDKDERVSSLLNWINSMSFGIASFGLQKFLQTRERGALIVNAAYRPVHSPSEPAFDWVTWNQIQRTMDRILQESVGYYNPAMHIILFVLLPSPSGNSVAIWRRKLSIPNNIRLAYQAQITQAMASLRKEYPVFVDEYVRNQQWELNLTTSRLPGPPEPIPPPPPKKKRKWYKLWLSS